MARKVEERGGYTFVADPRRAPRGAGARRGATAGDERRVARAAELHRRLTWAIERAGVTKEQFAAVAGVTTDALRNLKDGRTRDPSFFMIMTAARIAKVSPFFLAQLTDDPDDYRPRKT
jgi:hypothetical protein